jgi:hypothetical protein
MIIDRRKRSRGSNCTFPQFDGRFEERTIEMEEIWPMNRRNVFMREFY